ncbi:MAG: ABC transporter permease subunit [Anaerolineales bacterium]|nr:ABC transporter permease subunit [Anaerolineales bacterium]
MRGSVREFPVVQRVFDGIPDSIINAARVDGGSEWNIFRRIILPMSIPCTLSPRISRLAGRGTATCGRSSSSRIAKSPRSPSPSVGSWTRLPTPERRTRKPHSAHHQPCPD